MKAQTLVPLAAAAAAQLLVVGNIAAAFAFQQKPPVETLVTVPVVAEIEQVECVRQDPVPYEPVTYQVPLDAELQSYTEKMCDLYDVPLELAYAVMHPQLINEIWAYTAPGMISYAAGKSDWAARITSDSWAARV